MSDDRIWRKCINLNRGKPCHSHRNHKRSFLLGVWYGEVGRKPKPKPKQKPQ